MKRIGEAQRGAAARSTSEWLVALEDDAGSPDERQRFIAWLLESPLHTHEFLMAGYARCLLRDALNDAGYLGAHDEGGLRTAPLCPADQLCTGAASRDEQ